MDNNNQNTPNSGLTPENLKWLEEMIASNAPAPEATAEPTPEKTPEELEIENILSMDWDHIDLPEELAEEPAPVQEVSNTEDITPEQVQPEEKPVKPPRKGRPKKKDGYGLLGIPHIFA